jgi:UDP-galactopyranose mutase
VDHPYQFTPKDGFTELFSRMIDHPNITLALETDYTEIKEAVMPRLLTVYTGPVDEYFDFRLGKLPWRSLDFEFVAMDKEYEQPCVQINHPNEHDYTRSVEIKHVTKQQHPQTVISYEFPKAEGDPYYPIPRPDNQRLYEQYKALADIETAGRNVYFCGRLAEYKYYNTDEVIERALATFKTIQAQHGSH